MSEGLTSPTRGGSRGVVDSADLSLRRRLAMLRERAEVLKERPLRPLEERRAGFIEAMAIDEAGVIWVVGWMDRDAAFDRDVVIVDESKLPGAFAYTYVPRPDVPATATGFIGVLQSDWVPNRDSVAHVFLDADQRHLDVLKPLNIIPLGGFVEHCRNLWDAAEGGHDIGLRHLLLHSKSWSALPESFSTERAAVEEVLMLPGFGCLATGWLVSPTKSLEALMLKLDNAVLVSDDQSLSYKPRPDLAHIYPGSDVMIAKAGFTAVFRGAMGSEFVGQSMLRAVYDDGSTSNHDLPASAVRRLGRVSPFERAQLLFPAISSEPFFPEFALAARREAFRRGVKFTTFGVKPSEEALVICLPRERSDAALMFDQLRRRASGLAPGVGVILIAAKDQHRDLVVGEFAHLDDGSRPFSLVFIEDPAMAAYALQAILREGEVERFGFIGRDILLTDEGWAALDLSGETRRFFQVCDPVVNNADGAAGFSAFSWTREGWSDWLSGHVPLLGGPPAMVDALDHNDEVVWDGAWTLRIPSLSPFHAAMNKAQLVMTPA